MLFLLLGIEVIAAAYWVKSVLDEAYGRIDRRLDDLESNLQRIEQQTKSTGENA